MRVHNVGDMDEDRTQPTTTDAALTAIAGLLEGIDHGQRTGIGHRERLGLVERGRVVAQRLEALVAVLVGEADTAKSSLVARGTPMTSWLGRDPQTSAKQAAGLVFTGHDLTACDSVRQAALSGRIAVRQARVVTKLLGTMPPELSPEQRRAAEDALLRRAETMPAEKLAHVGPQVLAEVAPELASIEGTLTALDAQARRAQARRSLSFHTDGDGSTLIRGSLPNAAAARLRKLVDAHLASDIRLGRDATGPDPARRLSEYRSLDQRRADALMALVAAHESGRQAPGTAGDRPRIVVTMREADLRARAEQAGVLEDGELIGAGELRRLCCDADLMPAVLGAASEVLDIGRMQRLVTPAIRRALSLRDGGCVFPGCDARDDRCEAHHIEPWWDGGATAIANLALLCPHHHGVVEPLRLWTGPPPDRWQIRLDASGLPEFVPPARLDPKRDPIPGERHHAPELPRAG